MSRLLTSPSPVSTPLDEVQHLVLEEASWDLYEHLLKEIGNRPIRMTYDLGRLEIMSPLLEHEDPKKIVARLIEALTLELNLPIKCLGSTTFRRKDKAKGLEPDECYYFRDEKKMRGRKRLDMRKDPPPELVVEIDITSRSIDREPICAALGVSEIWRYDGRKLQCLHLRGESYVIRKHSLVFPFLEPALLLKYIRRAAIHGETQTIREFVKWVRDSKWPQHEWR